MAVEEEGRLRGNLRGHLGGDLRRKGLRGCLVKTGLDEVLHDELVVDVVQHHISDDLARHGGEQSSFNTCRGHVDALGPEDQTDLDDVIGGKRPRGRVGGVTDEVLDLAQDERTAHRAGTKILEDECCKSRCLDACLGDDGGDQGGIDAQLDASSDLVDGSIAQEETLCAEILGDDGGEGRLLDDDALLGEDFGSDLRSQTGGVLGTETCDEQLLLDLGGQLTLILERLDAVRAEVGLGKGRAGCGNDLTVGLSGGGLRSSDCNRSEQGAGDQWGRYVLKGHNGSPSGTASAQLAVTYVTVGF